MSRFSWRYEHWIIVHDHADLPPISLHVSFTFQFLAPIYPLFYIAEQFSSLALLGSDFEPPNTIIIFCQTKNLLPQLRLLTEAHGCSSPLPQPSPPPPFSLWDRKGTMCVFYHCWVVFRPFSPSLGKQKQPQAISILHNNLFKTELLLR